MQRRLSHLNKYTYWFNLTLQELQWEKLNLIFCLMIMLGRKHILLSQVQYLYSLILLLTFVKPMSLLFRN